MSRPLAPSGAVSCAALTLVASALAGCQPSVSTHYVTLGGPASAALAPVAATELHVGVVPARPFQEQGLVQAMGYGDASDEGALLAALRVEGRRRGCDAIVKVRVERGAGSGHAIGVCVRWADQTTRLRPPCLAS